jgi:IS4 transposase
VDNEREIVLLTNLFDFGATTIAAIYKERWKIELFFKALKQNLTVKSFVGTSENALRIQIWTALTHSKRSYCAAGIKLRLQMG